MQGQYATRNIFEITERYVPPFLNFFVEKEKFCAVFERKHIRKLRDFHSIAETKTWTNGYFCGFSTRQAANKISAEDNSAVLEDNVTSLCANVFCVCLYIKRGQSTVVLDFDSRFRTEFFALIYDGLHNQFWRESQPCNIQ